MTAKVTSSAAIPLCSAVIAGFVTIASPVPAQGDPVLPNGDVVGLTRLVSDARTHPENYPPKCIEVPNCSPPVHSPAGHPSNGRSATPRRVQ
jgi:hypothetical protein